MRSGLVVLMFALVPALAEGRRHRPKTKPPASKPADAPAEPTPPPEPAPAPAAADPKDAKPGPRDAKDAPAPPAPPAPPIAPAATADKPAKPADDAKPGTAPDVDTLRQEYLALRDELFKSRARAGTVASQLYSTRIQIRLTYTSGRFYNPAKSSIRLDGASVFEDGSGAIAGDDGIRFTGYVAPGRHVVSFRVEATGKDDDSFTSVTETQVVVKAVANKDLVVAAKAKDSGDIAYEWKRKEKGSYGLGIDVAVKATARTEAGGKP
jgi:hypothetical protein